MTPRHTSVIVNSVQLNYTKAVDKIEIFKNETEPAPTTTSDKNKMCYPTKKETSYKLPDNSQTKKHKKISRRDSYGSTSTILDSVVDEDNCVICLQERELNGKRSEKTRASYREESLEKSEVVNADIKVDRSKSDAQDKVRKEKEVADPVKNKSSSSSKFIKRSRSFSRIFSYSMLNRSKEYRL